MFNFSKLSLLTISIGSLMGFSAYTYSNQSTSELEVETKQKIAQASKKEQTIDEGFFQKPTKTNPQNNIDNGFFLKKKTEQTATAPINQTATTYQLGAGIADITGESAESSMFGYADSNQVSTGIQQRLNARAFLIGDGSKEVLMIILESGMASQAMHQKLLSMLQAKYGNRFTKDNVILSATHTHTAPGGYSHYLLYNLSTKGFQKETFNAILRGTVKAVDRAVQSQSAGQLEFGTNTLTNANVQRSHTAYVHNKKDKTATETDTLMQVLKFVKNGKDVASMNWFAVHPTSLTNKNTLVSPDNKGYASWYWEKQKGINYLTGEGYIAGFANSNAGDMSPNLNLRPGSGPTDDQWQNAKIIGQRQADSAMQTKTDIAVGGSVDYRQKYIDMSKQKIDPNYTVDGKAHTTCPAAYKTAFAAGSTEDGGGGDDLVASNLVNEGVKNPLIQAIGYTLFWPSKALIACHETDQVAIAMGTTKPSPMSPEVLPTQLVRIGNLAIIALPAEFTATSGKRIRKQVAKRLNLPLNNVIFTGYANAYTGYVATPEEYAQQDYEGASTHFGPHTQEAWLQNVDDLAQAMAKSETVTSEKTPRDLSSLQISLIKGVVFDNTPPKVEFGDVATQPSANYQRGTQAKAVFWSAHPKSTLAYERQLDEQGKRTTEPYTMAIQRKNGDKWVTVATDYDWNTVNKWQRVKTAQSHAILTWDIPKDAKSGEYRFYHQGAYKNGWTGKVIPFNGVSQSFMVE